MRLSLCVLLLAIRRAGSIKPEFGPPIVRGLGQGNTPIKDEPGTSRYACEGGVSQIIHELRCTQLGKTRTGQPCCEWHLSKVFTMPETGAGMCLAKEETGHEMCFCDAWKAAYFGCISTDEAKPLPIGDPTQLFSNVQEGWNAIILTLACVGCVGGTFFFAVSRCRSQKKMNAFSQSLL
eukprot:gnl/MRDRNA2_/MRDRNA2_61831_c0_seq2.p1 gnl/MRDRNA2_/MRDRNA2_61831_c0~~gnl/MRDRNA2_/MRDRNA2_61831_c0_seq2.p1  ORF type:complete len:179 (+),score=20.86 gnl/MRDRNA2_/MRDRNA2_61831_c0_seq2:118-654(+)